MPRARVKRRKGPGFTHVTESMGFWAYPSSFS